VFLLALAAALVVMFIIASQAGARLPDEPECRELTARRHDAWESVFAHFPERVDLSADGYIATTCDELGERFRLYVNGYTYNVVVADCLNREQEQYEALDIDYRLWRHAGLPNAPSAVILCKLPSLSAR
jgi:hypothetical protein